MQGNPDTQASVRFRTIFVAIACFHAFLLGYQALTNSPTRNEKAHLVAGLSTLEYQQFDLYRVNPPLVRTWATIPVALLPHKEDWSKYSFRKRERREAIVGYEFADANGPWFFWLLTFSRWFCIPFSLLGMWICGRWAMQLFGLPSGITAMLLWCSSPMILGHASLITADAHSATFGVATIYSEWLWLSGRSTKLSSISVGIVLGVAQLAKHTLLILYPVVCIIWLAYASEQQMVLRRSGQLVLVLLTSLLVLNLGYLLEGTLTPLKDYRFQTQLFTGLSHEEVHGFNREQDGYPSRFEGAFVENIPVPLPSNYLQGIDTQRFDFERNVGQSYLCGAWQESGWWYWYLCAFLFKTPTGTLILFATAVVMTMLYPRVHTSWQDELTLWLPLIAIMVAVSSQTGFSVHYRYALPALPFVFILASKVARAFQTPRIGPSLSVSILLLLTIAESLLVFPHSLSFFNSAVGGPRHGPHYLLYSNIDWGQDLHYLDRWRKSHPEATPLHFRISYGTLTLSLWRPPCRQTDDSQLAITPGWHALSVNEIYGQSEQNRRFLSFDPVTTAGYSIYIYHIAKEDTNRTEPFPFELRDLAGKFLVSRNGLPKLDEGSDHKYADFDGLR